MKSAEPTVKIKFSIFQMKFQVQSLIFLNQLQLSLT